MSFTKVGQVGDVPPGTAREYEIGGRSIAVCNVDGELFAFDALCTHAEGILYEGELEGHEIECPRHGARFDVRTGEAKPAPADVPVDTFGVRIEGADIEIDV